jgi:hypothetical protein
MSSRTDLESTIDAVVESFVKALTSELSNNIESLFVAGSYATRTFSLQYPNVNLYVISKANKSSELFLPISKIFHSIRRQFSEKINIAADLKPYRFAYFKPQKGRPTLSLRVNVFDMRDRDQNFTVPNYVLRGWAKSEKLLFGTEVLKNLKIEVRVDPTVLNQKRFVLLTIMQQLKHMPFSYDWTEEPELLYSESYEFAKYTLSEGLLLKMSEKEIETGLDVEIYENKDRFVAFFDERYGQRSGILAKKVQDAREHYLEWKDDVNRAAEMYATAWQIWGVIWAALNDAFKVPQKQEQRGTR